MLYSGGSRGVLGVPGTPLSVLREQKLSCSVITLLAVWLALVAQTAAGGLRSARCAGAQMG